MPVRAELAFMECLEGLVGAGSSRSRCREVKGAPAEKVVAAQPAAAGTAVMITTAWAIGGSSVSVMSRRAVIPAGVISSSRRKRAAGQPHRRLPRRQIDHPQVAPEDAVAEAGTERLRTGLLGGESAGIARRAIGTPVAFLALGIGKDAVQEAISKTLDHLLDAADVDQIAAECRGSSRESAGTRCPLGSASRSRPISRALVRPS